MTKLLLSIHVLAAIIAIGPVTVAASMFPAATRRALTRPAPRDRPGSACTSGRSSVSSVDPYDPATSSEVDPRDGAVLRNLHRICRVYAALGVLVPVFGLATAGSLGVLGDLWLIISMVLTVAAAAVLGFLVLPGQEAVLHGLDVAGTAEGLDQRPSQGVPGSPEGAIPGGRTAARLGMVTGVFNLLWAVVVVLMIVRPGSTTGA